jgi:hypothetical protein
MRALLLSFGVIAGALHAQSECPGFANCVYSSATSVSFTGQPVMINYEDVTGTQRPFEVWVRIPAIRTGKLPVVIWAHGGAEGRTQGIAGILQAPSDLTAEAGYLTVSPAFRPRTEPEHKALCEYFGQPWELCSKFETSSWDRPFDIRAIIRVLRRENDREDGPLFQRIDMDRIIVGGHSAGSSGTLSVAGAYRQIAGVRYGGPDLFEDAAPIAFIALSPSAPGASYMFDTSFRDEEHSWKYISRPVLFITGAGDAHEQIPRGRRVPYDKVPGGENNKFRAWFEDVSFSHANFGEEPCEIPGDQRRCAAFTAAWSSLILSYIDAYALKRPAAVEYLRNGYASRIPRGLFEIEWSVK